MVGARASNRQAASPHQPPSNGGGQIPQPIKRHLQFASMKPPFVPPEDYHRFSSGDARRVAATADHEAKAIVVKSILNDSEGANIAYSNSISLFKNFPKGWISWGNYCDKAYKETNDEIWLQYARIFLIKFLSDEVLSSATLRDHLDRCASVSVDLQQKLRSLTSEWKPMVCPSSDCHASHCCQVC